MRARYATVVLAVLTLLPGGCCLLIPSWPTCLPVPTTFTFNFANNRTSFCNPEFAVAWRLTYASAGKPGGFASIDGTTAGGQIGVVSVVDALDANNDGFADQIIVKVNTTCDPGTPVTGWNVLQYNNLVQTGATLIVTLDNNDNLTDNLSASASSIVAPVASAVHQVTGVKIGGGETKESEKPAPKKSCCW